MTPEAVSPLLEKTAPGLIIAIMNRGLQKFPAAMLSRAVAGVYGSTLIVTLPGSTGGVRDGIETLSPVLSHVLHLLADDRTDAHPVPADEAKAEKAAGEGDAEEEQPEEEAEETEA